MTWKVKNKGVYKMIHLHITGWVVAFILLFITFGMYKASKNAKVPHMILRLFYLIILGSGIGLLLSYHSFSGYLGEIIVKVLAGLWAIASMEMITVKASKGKATTAFWVQFVIAALIAIVLGFFRLPL